MPRNMLNMPQPTPVKFEEELKTTCDHIDIFDVSQQFFCCFWLSQKFLRTSPCPDLAIEMSLIRETRSDSLQNIWFGFPLGMLKM